MTECNNGCYTLNEGETCDQYFAAQASSSAAAAASQSAASESAAAQSQAACVFFLYQALSLSAARQLKTTPSFNVANAHLRPCYTRSLKSSFYLDMTNLTVQSCLSSSCGIQSSAISSGVNFPVRSRSTIFSCSRVPI
jgi:hypothetical protein